jgi:hypothetical protein
MGNARIAAQAMRAAPGKAKPIRLVELGAGDGYFLMQTARSLGSGWRGTRATLLDRQKLIMGETVRVFAELGWEVEIATMDVFAWSQAQSVPNYEVIVANLFLHHFDSAKLGALLLRIAQCTGFFVAVEPRRSWFSLMFSRLVGFIGCNRVTRHDAPVSVRAGFAASELSQLWPETGEWLIREQRVLPFSHLFVAQRQTNNNSGWRENC